MQRIAILLLLCSTSLSWASTYSQISPKQLQQELNRQFPLSRSLVLANLTFSQPELRVPEQGSRVGLALNLELNVGAGQSLQGELLVAGGLSYQATSQNFVLQRPQLVQWSMPGLPAAYQQPVKDLIEELMRQPLPLAQLRASIKSPSLAKQLQQGRLTSAQFNKGQLQLVWE